MNNFGRASWQRFNPNQPSLVKTLRLSIGIAGLICGSLPSLCKADPANLMGSSAGAPVTEQPLSEIKPGSPDNPDAAPPVPDPNEAEKLSPFAPQPDSNAPTPTRPRAAQLSPEDQADEDERRQRSLVVEEPPESDPYNNWLGFNVGLLLNSNGQTNGGYGYYAGAGIFYGRTVGKMILFDPGHIQDSLILEGSLYYYNLINLVSAGDGYVVYPLMLKAIYRIKFTETMGFFVYGGIMKNFALVTNVPTSAGAASTSDVQALLSTIQPAGGIGFTVDLGPGWESRVDLGIDTIGIGLMLRF